MSTTNYDREMEEEYWNDEYCCCDCGDVHSEIRCPKSGRCGNCGNDWLCEDCIKLLSKE